MDTSGINAVDVIVFVIVAIFGLMCFGWGLLRLLLITIVWIGAIAAAVFGSEPLLPFVAAQVGPESIPDIGLRIGAGVLLFVITLIILSILGNMVLGTVNQGRPLGPVDRCFGLLAGLGLGSTFVVSVYFLLLAVAPSDDHPGWLHEARTQPLLVEGAAMIAGRLPQRYRKSLGDKIEDARRVGDGIATIQGTVDRIPVPSPKADAPGSDTGYNGSAPSETAPAQR